MPAFANIVINDGQATPVAHTFATKTNDQRLSVYEDRAGGVAIGYPKIKVKTSESDVVRRCKFDISMPVLEAVSGANLSGFTPAAKVAYTVPVTIEFVLPSRCTAADRSNVLAYAKNLLALSMVTNMVVGGEEITG